MIQWHPVSNQNALDLLKNKAIVLPAIGPGNVGQLAVDILIESLGAEKIGVLSHPFILPSVGVDAYSHQRSGSLCHPLEIYHVRDSEYVLLQQRSPASAGCQEDFSKDLIDWLVHSAQVSRMWILGSLDASFRRDEEIKSVSQIRFIVNKKSNNTEQENETSHDNNDHESSKILDQMVKACQAKEFLKNEKQYSTVSGLQELDYRHWLESIGEKESFHMPWAFINAAMECSNTPIVILCAFVLEGENSREAFQVAHVAVHVCGLEQEPDKPVVLKAPPSWAGGSHQVPASPGYILT